MKKTIDKFAICYDEKAGTVTVASQIYLVRTDNPEEAVVAFDAKLLKFICDFEGHDLTLKRYALYKPEHPDYYKFFAVDIQPFVDALNEAKILIDEKLVAQIENKMSAAWYEDFACRNGLPSLAALKELREKHNET